MNTPHASLPAHLAAILAGQGPKIAHSAPVVQSRATPRAARFQPQGGPVDASQWDALDAHELTEGETQGATLTMGEW